MNAMAIAANGTPAKANQRNGIPAANEHPGDDGAEDEDGAEVVPEHDGTDAERGDGHEVGHHDVAEAVQVLALAPRGSARRRGRAPTFTISDGCTATGPIRSQFWLPPTAVPSGESTRSCSANADGEDREGEALPGRHRHPRGDDQRDRTRRSRTRPG